MTGRQAAVYDRYWRSQGGGERHAGMVAQVLAEDGAAVDLIGHEDTDILELGAHLGLDLGKCTYRQVPDRGDVVLSEVTADYDLFVNATYMSRLVSRARHSAYLCFFPTPADHDLAPWRKALGRRIGPHLSGIKENIEYGKGWFPPEGGRRRQWVWTSGDAVLSLPYTEKPTLVMELGRPGIPGDTTLTLADDSGNVLTKFEVSQEFTKVRYELPESLGGTELHFLSDTFVPGGVDDRTLGVAVSRAHLAGAAFGPRQRLAGRAPWLMRVSAARDLEWLDSYDVVMTNSAYTAGWIERFWGRGSEPLYPPIQVQRLHPSEDREPVILTVGRFFSPGLGHAKRQREMVEAFGQLHMNRALPGWRMVVVGGCEPSQEPYLNEVRTAAAGLPVEVIPNAARAEVERLLSTSSIFWSATGLGESETETPWAAEHFGMTTVEAMAGGCVPVVIDRAGQREIVREGVDGLRFQTLAEMQAATVRVAGDDSLLGALAHSAIDRAQIYDEDAFRDRWRAIAARHDLI